MNNLKNNFSQSIFFCVLFKNWYLTQSLKEISDLAVRKADAPKLHLRSPTKAQNWWCEDAVGRVRAELVEEWIDKVIRNN